MSVRLVWSTPKGQEQIAYMARVSNSANQDSPDYAKLIQYLVKHQHWSPFEMVNVCMEIQTTRDIARQILRHRSFSFQEFSQRYAQVQDYQASSARLQDTKNRQNSIDSDDRELNRWWDEKQKELIHSTSQLYKAALDAGVAKEVARKVLPEGLTMSRMYMNGTLRSWMHYVSVRCGPETQKEHRRVALECRDILTNLFPLVMERAL